MEKKKDLRTTEIFLDKDDLPNTILVVDDSRVVRAYLKSYLEKEGYDIILAENGKEAIKEITPDTGVILLDLWMPEMDGMACLRHIRENFPDIPTIMITVSHEISNAVEAMKYGAFDYVTKPFNPQEIISLIQQALKTRIQGICLRKAEQELVKARDHEIAIASRIQQTLLLGEQPDDMEGVQIAHMTIASERIDGDFYDFFKLNDHTMDLIVGDVMGKGIAAALMGAASKHHFMNILYSLSQISGSIPEPELIVSAVHDEIIDKMRELETFVTLCYARFDFSKSLLSYVDCGHMRTIHYHEDNKLCSLIQGVNTPLGFPAQETFTQVTLKFFPGDIFFFYSDGITEAKSPEGEFYGEERLTGFVNDNACLEPKELTHAIRNEIIEFSDTDKFLDDFTCVVVKIGKLSPPKKFDREWIMDIPSDLSELSRMRGFIRDVCSGIGKDRIDKDRTTMIEIVLTEIMTNIIKHAYKSHNDKRILIETKVSGEELMIDFYDWGIAFDFTSAPEPVFNGSKESGFGLHIIKYTADSILYTRDKNGRNCASVTFNL